VSTANLSVNLQSQSFATLFNGDRKILISTLKGNLKPELHSVNLGRENFTLFKETIDGTGTLGQMESKRIS
jgi:hypothetical protein